MDDLFDIIKTNMPDFDGEITMKDVYDYNQIVKKALIHNPGKNTEKVINPNIAAGEAISLNNRKLFLYFISQGGNDYRYNLIQAARVGNLDLLKFIISERNKTLYDINEPRSLQRSTRMALDTAAAEGNVNIVEYLTPLMQRYDRIARGEAFYDLMAPEFEDATRGIVKPYARVRSSLFTD